MPLAMSTANSPIVPVPSTTTDWPDMSVVWQACTALPKGSCTAATSGRMRDRSVGHRAAAGSFT